MSLTLQKHLICFLILISIVGMASAVRAEDIISTQQTGEYKFEIKLETSEVFDLDSATRRIIPTAVKLCSDRRVSFGKYRFEKVETINGSTDTDRFELIQGIDCIENSIQIKQPNRTPQLNDATAVSEAKSIVKSLSENYFKRLYSSVGDDAEAALSAIRSKKEEDRSAIFETIANTPIDINLFRMTVYDNSPSSPAEGVYIAVDYDNRVGNVAHHCGYLVWHSFDTIEYKLGRVESGTLPQRILESIADTEAVTIKKQLRCADIAND